MVPPRALAVALKFDDEEFEFSEFPEQQKPHSSEPQATPKALTPAKGLTLTEKWKIAEKLVNALTRRWGMWLPEEERQSLIGYSLTLAEQKFNPKLGLQYSTFLFHHVRGELIRLIRSRTKNESREVSFVGKVSAKKLFERQSQAEVSSDRAVLSQQCLKLLEGLPAIENLVMTKHYIEGIPLQDIAEELGYNRSYLYRVRDNALRHLREVASRTKIVSH